MSMGLGAAEGLQQVLQRLFLEAKFKQDQMEHGDRMNLGQQEMGQRSRALDIQEEGNRINAGLRQATMAGLQADREGRNQDRDAQRELTETSRLQGSLQMMPKGTSIDSPDMLVGMAKRGLGGMLRPVPNEPRFEFGGTQQQANTEERTENTELWRKTQADLAGLRLDVAQSRADAAGQKPSITPTAESNIINRLSVQWQKANAPVAELNRQLKLMDAGLAAAERGDMAAGAQTIMVTFQKILDPPSVVRESEYMRSAAGQSLVNRVKGWAEQLAIGGAGIQKSELQKFARLAREAAQAQATGYNQSVKERIGRTADHYNIPRDLIFEDFDMTGGEQGTQPAPAAQPASTQETKEQRMQRLLKASGGR